MAVKTRAARTTRTSRRSPRKRSGAAVKVRKRSTRVGEPDVVQAALAVVPCRLAKSRGKAKDKAKDKRRVGAAFAVSDSGIGLTMAEIKRLFRPFTQANVTIASRFGGAGLGLSSVKQLARAMGGDISVAPRRGGGATFTLTISLDAAEPEKSRKKGRGESEALAGLRVLSVEDNPFGRGVLN